MGVIADFCARLLRMCPGRLFPGFLLIRQEVRAIFKTCNQLDLKHDLGTHTGFQESGTGPGQPDLSDETAAVRDRPGFVVREAVRDRPGFVVREAVRDRPGGRGGRRQNFVLTLSYIP